MQGIGDILKKTRETKGITLQEVSEATKIRLKYLEAIEHEEFQLLPGEIYARGFVTTYLKYLGIKDQPEVLADYAEKSGSAAGAHSCRNRARKGTADSAEPESSPAKNRSTAKNAGSQF